MKAIFPMILLALALALGGCASSDDSDHSGDQPPGERKDGLGIIPGGAGFKQTF